MAICGEVYIVHEECTELIWEGGLVAASPPWLDAAIQKYDLVKFGWHTNWRTIETQREKHRFATNLNRMFMRVRRAQQYIKRFRAGSDLVDLGGQLLYTFCEDPQLVSDVFGYVHNMWCRAHCSRNGVLAIPKGVYVALVRPRKRRKLVAGSA